MAPKALSCSKLILHHRAALYLDLYIQRSGNTGVTGTRFMESKLHLI